MCRRVGITLLCMCKVFLAGRGEQMTVISFNDVMVTSLGRDII